MPRSKEKKKRVEHAEETLSNAIKLVKEKKFTLNGAALHFNLPRTTLRRYYEHCSKEGTTIKDLHKNLSVKKVFDDEQEGMLVTYIKEAALLQYGLTLRDVKVLAYQFAKANNIKYPTSWDSDRMAGDFWLRLFRNRNKELSLRKPEATSLARSSAFNKHTVGMTFDNFKKALAQCPSGVAAVDIWNMDETGLSTVHVPPKILAPIGVKQIGSMTSGERGTTVTMIAACNAGGGFVPPMLIFPRVNFKDFMLLGAPEGSIGAANPSGWSNESLFVMFMEHFIRYAKPSKERPVILLLDNHESHISVPGIQLAKDNGVILVTLHPHTSNKMQPLDKTVFGPFKTYFNQAAKEKMMTPGQIGKPLTIYDISHLVGKAFPLAFTPSNITSGFKATGFHPLNENIFSESDYLASEFSNRLLAEEPSEKVLSPMSKEINTQGDLSVTEDNTEVVSVLPEKERVVTSLDDAQKGENEPGPSSSKIVTPKMLRPHPKASPRKGTRKGRQKGKSRILTDTPEKAEIESLKSAKKAMPKKTSQLLKAPKSRVKRKILPKSDSDDSIDDCDVDAYSVHDSDDSCGEVNKENVDFVVGDFVIFIYEEEHFVGKVESICDEGVLINSMQKSLKNWKWPAKPDVNLYLHEDIKQKIAKPKKINSKRDVYSVPEISKYW